jgi:SAM-dependent methyltransferase
MLACPPDHPSTLSLRNSELMRRRTVRSMSGDAFAEFERAGWERAAPRYEGYWTDTVLFVEPLLDAAGVRAGSLLLDVACGPGFVSEAAAARAAHPVGVDIATAMVERARIRCPDLNFVVGDALRLPFPDAFFDAVTINFGILHVSHPERALAEAHRVLAPGGRLAFTTWVAEGNAEDEITEAALAAHAIPVEVPEGPSYHVFADRDECRRALAGCGFDMDSLRMDTVTALWRVPSADFLFQAQLHAGVRTAAVLRAQPPDRLEAIRTTMADAVRAYADGEEFALPIAARLISAQASGEGEAERGRH